MKLICATVLALLCGVPWTIEASHIPKCLFAWAPGPMTAAMAPLAGYRIYKARRSGQYPAVPMVDIPLDELEDVGRPRWFGNCQAGKFFVVTAYDIDGLESAPSNEVESPDARR